MPPPWICPSRESACSAATLCTGCFGQALASLRGQADVLGQQWAERVARTRGAEPSWPAGTERSRARARQLVRHIATDPRLVEPLAEACEAGAAAWWERRPERYRRFPPASS